MITKTNIKDLYECSPLQKGILFHALDQPKNPAYFQQIKFTIKGQLQVAYVKKSLEQLVQKYDILRTLFSYRDFKQPIQIVLKEMELSFGFYDFSNLAASDRNSRLKSVLKEDREQGFDLTKGPLIRFLLFQLEFNQYMMVWSFHHILMDGWCLGILLEDWLKNYQQLFAQQPISVEPAIPYSRYIQWIAKQDQNKALAYWRDYLDGVKEPVGFGVRNGEKDDREHQTLTFRFSKVETEQMVEWTKCNQVTLSSFIQTVWGILLQKVHQSHDVVFGTVVSGRHSEIQQIEKMVGLFINTVPTRFAAGDDDLFLEAVKRVQQNVFISEKYDYISLADIQAQTPWGNRLIDHILVFESYPLDSQQLRQKSAKLGFVITDIDAFEQTNYALNLIVYPGKQLELKFIFQPDQMNSSFIRQLFVLIRQIVKQVLANPYLPLKEIEWMSEEAKKSLIYNATNQPADYSKNQTVLSLFEQQVKKYPNQVAVVCDEE